MLNRPEWRDSDHCPAIARVVSAALHDANPVVRMQAAYAARAVHADADAAHRAAAVGELLLAERDTNVRMVLLDQLAADSAAAPATVDAILERLVDGDPDRQVAGILTYLALVPRTPFASRLIERWCADASAHPQAVQSFVQHARSYLRPPADAGQIRAFRLLDTTAHAVLAQWTRYAGEHRAEVLSDDQLAELRGAAGTADDIAQQIYFASGAFDDKRGRQGPSGDDLTGFADLAFPVLAKCAALRHPHSIHQAVETMIFLAPVDEARALHGVAEAIPADGPYASESLAGDLVIPYLQRLLAEQRPLVLHDERGVASFRHLLATFAVAGNQAALTLAYTFADVFR
ncbi:hypothetical protein [Virgisporangium ochraceum]|uniref:hypothetical protein n=1 Tax=Virgisporangium ochraceum TaxID=65505 RepID=UPI001940AC2D|nr:hypothetical protein [Virgisporangium ochraceum]